MKLSSGLPVQLMVLCSVFKVSAVGALSGSYRTGRFFEANVA
jgi:hypothetical protein